MATQDPQTQIPQPPLISLGEDVYNQIMGQIEPELTTSVVKMLKEKYKDETPEQAKARAVRYSAAFAEYDKQYQDYKLNLERGLRHFQKGLGDHFEHKNRNDEAGTMSTIEAAFSQA
ncbi:hypothetical protein HYZ99_02970 [Candidatus Peregrinibacteria bacterium]|nr:hypothetical protein [Candidatus Peregrinibacteria bacterium]